MSGPGGAQALVSCPGQNQANAASPEHHQTEKAPRSSVKVRSNRPPLRSDMALMASRLQQANWTSSHALSASRPPEHFVTTVAEHRQWARSRFIAPAELSRTRSAPVAQLRTSPPRKSTEAPRRDPPAVRDASTAITPKAAPEVPPARDVSVQTETTTELELTTATPMGSKRLLTTVAHIAVNAAGAYESE